MKTLLLIAPSDRSRASIRPWSALVLLPLVVGLAACGGGDKKDKPASQVAAKVNKEEISVHQINFVLQQQRGLRADQTDVASRQVLERLVDQELAVQRAQEMKLDREPRVVQQIEAAKREIVARAYVERVGDSAAKPSPTEVNQYYADKPALFKSRRVYNIQELAIEAKPEQLADLRARLAAAKTVDDFIAHLKASNIRFGTTQAVRAAEQLPLNMLDTFARMKDGEALLSPSPSGAQVFAITSSKLEPVDETLAKPAIEQFLLNDAKRKTVEANMKALRGESKIEYVGKFAQAATAAPAPAPAAAPAASAAGGLNAEAINKGLGIKK